MKSHLVAAVTLRAIYQQCNALRHSSIPHPVDLDTMANQLLSLTMGLSRGMGKLAKNKTAIQSLMNHCRNKRPPDDCTTVGCSLELLSLVAPRAPRARNPRRSPSSTLATQALDDDTPLRPRPIWHSHNPDPRAHPYGARNNARSSTTRPTTTWSAGAPLNANEWRS